MRTTKQLINEMSKLQEQSLQEITKDLAQEKKRAMPFSAISIAMRTRTYAGIPQRIEVGGTICNSITTVTKDFLVLIIL